MKLDNTAFLQAIPKSDLHVHLDGSLRLSTLIELAASRNVALPSMTEDGLRELVFRERYDSLVDYLKGFRYTTAVLQDPEALEQAAYELAKDNQAEGVLYLEPRLAPQLHLSRTLSMDEVLRSVDRGLDRAAKEYNAGKKVVSNETPPFHYGILVCAMRSFDKNDSKYFRSLFRLHNYSEQREIRSMASLELARAAVRIRDDLGLPVVGFDLAGREDGFPAARHVEAYRFAHKNFMNKTVHAGEAYGAESIFQAITDLHADRIGHSYHLFNPDKIVSRDVKDKAAYVEKLSQYIADHRVTVESCLTSNEQTIPEMKDLKSHSVAGMLERRISVTFCTDNRLVSSTTVTNELQRAIRTFAINPKKLRDVVITGFKRSFFPGTYADKRRYVRRIINHYDAVVKRFRKKHREKSANQA